ncbi:hypothetical protein BFC18_11025 [Alteromonas confluentis]|uniref:Uncharacterized protein n=1 Tax=Alteromonas confluentis TaxID=1656094 RepID=A0A1E7ZBW6_9ALTE|nr:hypothetical protein BFC18_11025 [Alteromonas confluentis]
MDNDKLIFSLEKFSGSLLITIFAIFAFTSGALLSTNSYIVKSIFLISLSLAILGLVFSYRAISIPINVYASQDIKHLTGTTSRGRNLNVVERNKMIRYVNYQWRLSIISLLLLTISVAFFLFTDNTPSFRIKDSVKISATSE